MEDIEDKVKAIFKARGKTTKDKADEVDKTKLLKLLTKEVVRIGLPAVPTIWEPIAAVPKPNLEVVNLSKELIFATQHTGKPISGFNIGVEFINLHYNYPF